MLPSLVLAAFIAAPLVFADPTALDTTLSRVCGTVISAEQVTADEAHFQANKISVTGLSTSREASIPIYFHVISAGSSLLEGNIPDFLIESQMIIMNTAYATAGITWTLAGVTRTVYAKWFDSAAPGNPSQTAMKQALRRGGANALNVYTVGFNSGASAGIRGYSTFPADYSRDPIDDGVVMLYSSISGGITANCILSQTLIHEAGHWAGLYHTCQGGCGSPDDKLGDTREASSGVLMHNVMDNLFNSSCLNQFTAGQITRMRAQLATYRGING
ncbi:hypothetical protein ONZ45_g519 [Pleurotus djamor]|nr:hypothetical protein ONZ45_g519 [Pleurotus djamor]